MKIEHFTDLEVTLHGLTFLVTGTYYPYMDGGDFLENVAEEFDIVTHLTRVKGQPEANTRGILRAFDCPALTNKRYNIRGTGQAQLEDAVLMLIGVVNA